MEPVTQLVAHAGADGTPDNSMAYLHHVLADGPDAFEIDVRRHGDGLLALAHDAPGTDAVTLEAALTMVARTPDARVNIDHKEHGLSADVDALLRRCGMAGRAVWTGSVDLDFLERTEAAARSAEVWLNLEELVPELYRSYREIPDFELTAAKMAAEACRRYAAPVVNVYFGIVTRRLIRLLADEGIGVSVWTVNDERDIRWFLNERVHSITTRNLAGAKRIMGRA